MIAVSRRGEVVRIARLRGDVLVEFWLWDLARPDGVGDVHTGRIARVMPALAGRFVALGGGDTGFLPDSAGGKGRGEGDYLAVEITRAAQGEKGPRLRAVADPPGPMPGLLRRGPGPLLDLAARAPGEDIILDDHALLAQLRPALEGRMHYAANAFDAVLEDELAGLAELTATLPGGARMHVAPTPAAVLIDIDASSASSQAPLALNTAIIPELCRQIVLRNLSGGILVDFAGLKPASRKKLSAPLSDALKQDFLAPEFLGFSNLGFAEITRRRVRPPLHEVLHEVFHG